MILFWLMFWLCIGAILYGTALIIADHHNRRKTENIKNSMFSKKYDQRWRERWK